MKPYYERGGVTIYHGEACNVLRDMEPGWVDVLLTDPPYSSGGLHSADRKKDALDKYISTSTDRQYLTFSGDGRDQRSWELWVAAWSWGAARVARPGAHGFMFCDWRQVPSAASALQLGGWLWRGLLTWHKPNGGIPQRGRFKQNSEFIAWGSNGPLEDLSDQVPDAVLKCSNERNKLHPTAKPVGLLTELLRVVPNLSSKTVVLDPFMGGGSTLEAARAMGLQVVGIEIEERYCEIAAKRLAQEVFEFA